MKTGNDPIQKELQYPIGKFQMPDQPSPALIKEWIATIDAFPQKLRNRVDNLNDDTLNRRYRPGGWTIRQVVHHCADSHMNSYFRFKLALTEDRPVIKPYFEDRWADLPDLQDIQPSIRILTSLHSRWVYLLQSLNEAELKKEFYHPQSQKFFSLKETIGLYAWHSNHHLAHIMIALKMS